MITRRLLTLNLDNEPAWIRLYVYPVGEHWAAAILGDIAPLPETDSLRGLSFFGETPEEVERLPIAYLGKRVSRN